MKAKWIDPELKHDKNQRQCASVLRRKFTAKKAENATLSITCHGLYTAVLNGRRVGVFVLAPGVDDYKKRLQVQSYNVTELLKEGENTLVVTLGDGWYRGNNGIDGSHNLSGTDLALLCELEADGETILITDETWEASQDGPVRENDMEKGEVYDARKEEITIWHPVKVKDYGYSNLVPTDTVQIKEQERFKGHLIKTPNGELVFDFGQNLAGYTEIKVEAHEGQAITLWHGETLDENGNFTQSNYDPGARNKNGGIPQKITYTCKEGLNIYKPQFSIFGFRYAKLETDIEPKKIECTSIAVYSDMKQVGFFSCGNKDVNKLFENTLWSMRSNFCDIPTDCPTRERAGWTGDAGVFAPTAVMLMDCYPVLRKWLNECRIAQGKDGKVANIAPANNVTGMIGRLIKGSAGWGDACVLVPWALYEAYGKTEILEENYEMMTRWVDFCTRRASKSRRENSKNPYKKYLVDKGFHFGEWLEPDVPSMVAMRENMSKGAPEVATAYYYRSALLLSKIASILGKTEDSEKYAAIAQNARLAYRYKLVKNGKISSTRQCSYVRPISFGLLEPEEIQGAADDLNELVKKNNYHLNTGFLSTPDLCRVLADNNHTDTAYKLLLQESCPSWLYAVKKGATTIWETWDGIREDGTVHDSLNHYSYGAITGWLFGGVCGIRKSVEGLSICPKPEPSLKYAQAQWLSPFGVVKSSWKYEKKSVVFDFTVPCEATLILPNGETNKVKAGEYHYKILL